jgi:cytochrome c556
MAQKLKIDIVAKDRSKQALQGLQGSLARVKASVFNLRNAFIGLGAGLVIRNIVNTGKQIENLQVQLKFLFGSAQEGAKAFDEMAKFAAKVPFSLAEIQQGAGVLAVVSKDAEQMAKMMKITGNVAAVTGLDFKTTAEQIQRSMSAGISAADLFRDRGVKSMLGFKAGATVSIEETVAAFDRVFGKGGKFGNATKELAKTFEGTLSMIGDKVFNFKKVLLEAGFFAELKNQFGDLNKFLEDNSKQIDGIAKKIGSTLGRAVAGIANNMKKVKENIHGFRIAIEVLISLNVVIFLSNVAKALMLVAKSSVLLGIGMSATKKGIIGIIAAGALLKGVFLGVDKLFEKLLKDIEELSKWQHTFGGNPFEKTRQSIAGLSDEAKKLSDEFDKAFNANRISRSHDAMHETMNETQKGTLTLKERFDELNKTSIEKLQNHFLNIKETIAVGINNAITKVSQGLARSLILGENLSETFKKMAQELLIRILSITIEIIARKGIELALERLKTAELTKQLSLRSAMSAISMFTGFGFFGGQQHGGAVSKGKPVLVGERGPELFVPNTTGQITQNARGTGGVSTNVNFSITTLDASGFSEMLVQNRGTISAIINQAVNERGASNIV